MAYPNHVRNCFALLDYRKGEGSALGLVTFSISNQHLLIEGFIEYHAVSLMRPHDETAVPESVP